MDLTKQKKQIIKIGKKLAKQGLTPGKSGNISVKVNEGILVTCSQTCLGELELEDIALIDESGKVIQSDKKCSTETKMHLEIYKLRTDIKSIIHIHPPALSSFAACKMPLEKPLIAEAAFYFEEIPVAPYYLPSTDELATNTAKYFENYNAILMANHGVVIGDKDLKSTYYLTQTAETYAQICINSKILGAEAPLSPQDVKEINDLKNSYSKK